MAVAIKPVALDYDELVKAYSERLLTVLRGFKPGVELLDTWVPDDDHCKSLLNLAEAAQLAGMSRLEILIGTETAKSLDLEHLQELVSELGSVAIDAAPGGYLLKLDMAGDGAASSIHAVYRDEVLRAAGRRQHEGRLHSRLGLQLIVVAHDDGNLSVLADPCTNLIREAAYEAPASEVVRGLLETLCDVLVEGTVQEASDHAAIRVEYRLRDHSQPAPVPGIVMPENADPAFGLVMDLTRRLADAYRQLVAGYRAENWFQRLPTASWLALSEEQKLTKLEPALASILPEMGIDPKDVAIVEIEDAARVVIDFGGDYDSTFKAVSMMRLEARLKETVEENLELYGVERKDVNKLRRL